MSVTTNRDEIRRLYESRCEPIAERLAAISALRRVGTLTRLNVVVVLAASECMLNRQRREKPAFNKAVSSVTLPMAVS